jgi:hypothetical protein
VGPEQAATGISSPYEGEKMPAADCPKSRTALRLEVTRMYWWIVNQMCRGTNIAIPHKSFVSKYKYGSWTVSTTNLYQTSAPTDAPSPSLRIPPALSYGDFQLFSPVGIALPGCLVIIFVSETLPMTSRCCDTEPPAVTKSGTLKNVSYSAKMFRS